MHASIEQSNPSFSLGSALVTLLLLAGVVVAGMWLERARVRRDDWLTDTETIDQHRRRNERIGHVLAGGDHDNDAA